MTYLYVYTEPAWEYTEWTNGRIGCGLVKVGQTIHANVEHRVKGQFPSGKPYKPYKILFSTDIGSHTDKEVHKMLTTAGAYNFPNSEWFECTVEEVQIAIHCIMTNARIRPFSKYNESNLNEHICKVQNQIKEYKELLKEKETLKKAVKDTEVEERFNQDCLEMKEGYPKLYEYYQRGLIKKESVNHLMTMIMFYRDNQVRRAISGMLSSEETTLSNMFSKGTFRGSNYFTDLFNVLTSTNVIEEVPIDKESKFTSYTVKLAS